MNWTDKRGTIVIARCYEGKPALMRVWESNGKLIYLSEESQFEKLVMGRYALQPIGFPPEDVFTYDPNLAEDIANGSIDWSSLELFDCPVTVLVD